MNSMFQVSSLQALLLGYYRPVINVQKLKEHGDTGLGTFAQADGEMIVLDGHVFQADYDGSIKEADDADGIPFGTVSFFAEAQKEILTASDMNAVEKKLDEAVRLHRNHMAVIRLEGCFDHVCFRAGQAVPAEKDVPLADWLQDHQQVWEEKNIDGTIVGVYFPSFMDHLNTPGWHLHFLSADHTRGGHVLNLSIHNGRLSVSYCDGFAMVQPDDAAYESLDLARDQTEAIASAEKQSR